MSFVLGRNAKVYYGTAGTALTTLTELNEVTEVTLNLEADELDVTTRSSGGQRAYLQGHRDFSPEITTRFKAGDAGQEALRDAYLDGSTVEIAILSGGKAVSGSEGPRCTMIVTNMTRNEALDGTLELVFSLKPAGALTYEEVTGS